MLFKVGEFKKVSFDQFIKDMCDSFGNMFSFEEIEQMHNNIKLPSRAHAYDAGYDFFAPFDFKLKQNEVIKIPTGIRVFVDDGWFLGCFPRSGLGFKYFSSLANSIGIIDAGYVLSSNEGHIMCKMINRNPKNIEMEVKVGQGFMQGIFLPHGITYNDETDGIRNGGFGSSDNR